MRAQSECQSYALSGVGNDKKVLLDFFQKIAGSSGQSPWSLHRNGAKSLFPKISSARGSKMPAGILRRGRIARASPMKKVRSMRAFFIIVRAVNYRLRTHWNYVGRHGANVICSVPLADCPVDSQRQQKLVSIASSALTAPAAQPTTNRTKAGISASVTA